MTIIGRQSGPDFRGSADALVTSSVLISCWVSSALVEHWVRRPSSRSAQTSIIDCTSFRARRISSSPSAIPRAQRSTRKPRGSSPGGTGPFLFHGHNWPATRPGFCSQDATLSLLLLRVTKPLINIDNHLGRLYR